MVAVSVQQKLCSEVPQNQNLNLASPAKNHMKIKTCRRLHTTHVSTTFRLYAWVRQCPILLRILAWLLLHFKSTLYLQLEGNIPQKCCTTFPNKQHDRPWWQPIVMSLAMNIISSCQTIQMKANEAFNRFQWSDLGNNIINLQRTLNSKSRLNASWIKW